MNSIALDVFGNLAFLLTTCAYMVRDIIKLRIISIMSSTIWLIYLFTKSDVLWISVFWNFVFIAVNLAHIAIFVRQTGFVELKEKDEELRRRVFPNVSVSDYKRLIAVARWTDFAPGERLTEAGKNTENVMLIVHGSVRVDISNGLTSQFGAGHFVGEVSFFESGSTATATVIALEPLHCLVWPRDKLRKLLDGNSTIRNEFHAIMTGEFAHKLTGKFEIFRARPPA